MTGRESVIRHGTFGLARRRIVTKSNSGPIAQHTADCIGNDRVRAIFYGAQDGTCNFVARILNAIAAFRKTICRTDDLLLSSCTGSFDRIKKIIYRCEIAPTAQ